jgi:hypothetical protein
VSSYTITITPDDTTNASATLRVNLGANGARIMELTVRAGDGDGFSPEELPGFELSRLIGAITPAPARPVLDAAGAALPASGAPALDVVYARAAEVPADAGRPARKRLRRAKTAATAKTAGTAKTATTGKTAATAKTAGTGKTARTARAVGKAAGGRPAARKAPAKKVAARKAATTVPQREARAYRRMPDDIIEVFHQAGGATALARHYGVPRHTAQGWLRRLRQQGDLPS